MITADSRRDRLARMGIDPPRVSEIPRRENAATRARRLLVESRVMIYRVDERGVLADVRGDSGVLRRVVWDTYAGLWSCDCPARSERCAHVRAVAAVVVVGAEGAPS
jgi:uncharacterized Zn finger protein